MTNFKESTEENLEKENEPKIEEESFKQYAASPEYQQAFKESLEAGEEAEPEVLKDVENGSENKEKEEKQENSKKVERKKTEYIVEEIKVFFKIKETAEKNKEKKKGILARLGIGKSRQNPEEEIMQAEGEKIYNELIELEKEVPDFDVDAESKDLIDKFKKVMEGEASQRMEKIDQNIESMKKGIEEEKNNLSPEKKKLFERVKEGFFDKGGAEILIALMLLTILAISPRENALEIITNGHIQSFLPLEWAQPLVAVSGAMAGSLMTFGALKERLKGLKDKLESKKPEEPEQKPKEPEQKPEPKEPELESEVVTEEPEQRKEPEADQEQKPEPKEPELESEVVEEESDQEKKQENVGNISEEERETLDFIKESMKNGEEIELKYKGNFGWYSVVEVKEDEGKRPLISLKRKGTNEIYTNVDLGKLELVLRDLRKIRSERR